MFNNACSLQLRALGALIEARNEAENKRDTLANALDENAELEIEIVRKDPKFNHPAVMTIESEPLLKELHKFLVHDLDVLDTVIRDKLKFIVENEPTLMEALGTQPDSCDRRSEDANDN